MVSPFLYKCDAAFQKRLESHFLLFAEKFCRLTGFDSFFKTTMIILAYSIDIMLYADKRSGVRMIAG